MKKTTVILLLSYYLFGTLCLSMGDFSVMKDLPEMYRHCKATEDKDMTFFDFVTDHLLNIDCVFDKHDNGDEQKPHTSIPFNHIQLQTSFLAQDFKLIINKPILYKDKLSNYVEDFYYLESIFKIFHPPKN